LLIWIDDDPDGNASLVTVARNHHVKVIEFTSTASATAWIEANESRVLSSGHSVHVSDREICETVLLHRMDSEGKLRFITDNVRLENSLEGPLLNLKAGEYVLRYLRGRLFRAPVLVFCNTTIMSTQFVKLYEVAGSTICSSVVERYISSLARQRQDDVDWRDFHVFP
jgi:hypothetical protein